jgi:hypothetical protein
MTSYVVGAVGTYNWSIVDVVGTFRWWILAASIVDSTLTGRPEHLDVIDVMGSLAGGSPTLWGPPLARGPPTL